jgi:hypothetical protein
MYGRYSEKTESTDPEIELLNGFLNLTKIGLSKRGTAKSFLHTLWLENIINEGFGDAT